MRAARLMSADQAAARILRVIRPLPAERAPLAACAGRVLRETLRSDRAQPPYDRVTMDGFALSSKDWKRGRRAFPVLGIQRAGEAPERRRTAGGCVEIMTGAVLPPGCDAVVPVERVVRRGGTVEVAALEPGRFIHRRGSDLKRGAVVLRPGVRLDASALGIAATVGRSSLRVTRAPRVALVTTGDEVVPVRATPLPHQIRASNASALAASLRLHGITEVTGIHLPDERTALEQGLRKALAGSDLLILTGGVSKGRFDFVPGVLAGLGVRSVLHGVEQQPGKPLWFGRTRDGRPVFGLPGNPVSALVCLHRYVLPALDLAAGAPPRKTLLAVLGERPGGPDGYTQFRPVRLSQGGDGRPAAELVPTKNSGDFFPLADSDGFVEIPPGFEGGGLVAFRPWRPA